MKIGIYAFWSLGWDGQILSGPGFHLRYIRNFLKYCDQVHLFTNISNGRKDFNTEILQDNRLRVVPIPWGSWITAWMHLNELRRFVAANLDGLDSMYVRLYDPCSWLLAPVCEKRGIGMLFHIVGDPLAGIFQRDDWSIVGKFVRRALFFPEEQLVKRAVRRHDLIVEGGELADLMRKRGLPCDEVMSSTLIEDDFYFREDTCQGSEAVVLMVSHFRPPKRVEVLLESVGLLLREGRSLKLRLVGPYDPASYKNFLLERVKALGIEKQVDFVGYVPLGGPLRAELRAADIFAFPSATEGNPRVLLEAAANSLPIVTTEVGSVRQMYTNKESALIVPIGDSQPMANAIIQLIDNKTLRQCLIQNAFKLAQRHTCNNFIKVIVERLKKAHIQTTSKI